MTVRILVTGWRFWPVTSAWMVGQALASLASTLPNWASPQDLIVVHGECPYGGVDLWAHQWALQIGATPEPHPAPWKELGRRAGMVRNQHMVNLGADVCAGFPGPGSRGTVDCLAKAAAAGIPTVTFPWPATST